MGHIAYIKTNQSIKGYFKVLVDWYHDDGGYGCARNSHKNLKEESVYLGGPYYGNKQAWVPGEWNITLDRKRKLSAECGYGLHVCTWQDLGRWLPSEFETARRYSIWRVTGTGREKIRGNDKYVFREVKLDSIPLFCGNGPAVCQWFRDMNAEGIK